MSWLHPKDVGFAVRSKLADVGYGARLMMRLLATLPATLRRPALLRDQIHFMGNYSLAIIAVSGIFVGFVLGFVPDSGDKYSCAESIADALGYAEAWRYSPAILHSVTSSVAVKLVEAAQM